MKKRDCFAGSSVLSVAMLLIAQPAVAQEAASDNASTAIGEIIVTAQKREESINTVPMSITAASAEELRDAGVTEIRDLVRVTPGLSYADSGLGTPIYTIRGIGFSDYALAGRPAVTVYADQAPVPFAIETRGVSLDLERVEVLKGPQGTLFGSNTTGGAINFVAAKPTHEFAAGADFSYGRFNSREISAFVSGPITSTLSARLAVAYEGMDAWQESYTSDAKLGVKDFWNGRLILDWEPSDRLKMSLTLNQWIDHSDTQAQQLLAVSFSAPLPVPELQNYPLPPHNNRAADFDIGRDYSRNNKFTLVNFRLDYDISDALTLTSLTSYSRLHEERINDLDGTTVSNNYFNILGKLRSISEELRLSASIGDRANITIGGYYADDDTDELYGVNSPISSISNLFSFLLATPLPVTFDTSAQQDSVTKAVFGNIDYDVTDSFKIYAGGRYTDFKTDFSGCTLDSGDGVAAIIFSALSGTTILPGQCVTILAGGTAGLVNSTLAEDNFSWRAGAQFTASPGVMFYANVSKGYKAGSFPSIPADSYLSFTPVKQESVLAYEAGFKAALMNRMIQLNGAVFYYDYSDKQLLGQELFAGGSLVSKFVNVPKSRIAGAEFEFNLAPVEGLKISTSGTYVDSKVTESFMNIGPLGTSIDFKGEPFPNTPKWQLTGDVQYTFPFSDRIDAFLGGNIYYQSQTNSQFGQVALYNTKEYARVDLRAGVETEDGKLRASVWGRNMTNTYYWSSATHVQDAIVRFMGMPRTYGVSLSLRY